MTGGELSFLKLGSVLAGFEWMCVEFFLKASTGKITVFEVKCVLTSRLELKWSQDNSYVLDSCVC